MVMTFCVQALSVGVLLYAPMPTKVPPVMANRLESLSRAPSGRGAWLMATRTPPAMVRVPLESTASSWLL